MTDGDALTPAVADGLNMIHTSTAERVALVVREMILSGQFAPGTRVPEEDVARLSGVSRNTAREAIQILAREGLISHQRHRGAVVAELREDDVTDIYRVRLVLELAGIDAAETADPAQLRRVEDKVRALKEAAAAHNREALVEHDLAFHRAVVHLMGSRRADEFFDHLESSVRFCLSVLSSVDREYEDPFPVVAEHEAIFAAITARDIARARDLMRAHLTANERRLREILVSNLKSTSDGR